MSLHRHFDLPDLQIYKLNTCFCKLCCICLVTINLQKQSLRFYDSDNPYLCFSRSLKQDLCFSVFCLAYFYLATDLYPGCSPHLSIFLVCIGADLVGGTGTRVPHNFLFKYFFIILNFIKLQKFPPKFKNIPVFFENLLCAPKISFKDPLRGVYQREAHVQRINTHILVAYVCGPVFSSCVI